MKRIFPSTIHHTLATIDPLMAQFDRHVPGYHIDIMDGVFVPNKVGSVALANHIAAASLSTTQWVHLMVEDPLLYIKSLVLHPGSCVSFHFETNVNIESLSNIIREKKWRSSVAISPKTAPEKIFPFLTMIDHVLVMSVDPGYAGQSFLPQSIATCATLAAYRSTAGLNFTLGVDGGVSADNCLRLANAGVDDFAVASALFNAADPIAALAHLQQIVDGQTL